MTLQRAYGPYTILDLNRDVAYDPNSAVHLAPRALSNSADCSGTVASFNMFLTKRRHDHNQGLRP